MARLAHLTAVLLILSAVSVTGKSEVRVLFLTDCSIYSDWQSVGWVFSFKFAGHDGPLTRVMCCEEDKIKTYPKDMMDIVETHVAPSFTVHPRNHDIYAAYNKPEAVVDYLENVTPEEEWLVVLDSDMLLRHPFKVSDYNISKGWAAGAKYTYMIGVSNPLADRHIPEIPKRNDTFAGPFGRRSDQVGGFFFSGRDDMKRISKLWLKYTEDVRADPEAWRYTGDVYAVKPGMKPWISEMYGYSYGAAKADVWHHWDDHTMLYPAYLPGGIPKVLHYGLYYEFQGYSWDKHRFFDFNITKCPPWDLSVKNPNAGVFHPPPRPSEIKLTSYLDLYKDLIAIENVVTLNAGFCDYHRKHCEPSEQLEKLCKEALIRFLEAKKAVKIVEDVWDCIDHMPECAHWKNENECTKNPGFMGHNCKVACGFCKPKPYAKHPDILDTAAKVIVTEEEYAEAYKFLGYDKLEKPKPAMQKHEAEMQKAAVEGSGQQGAHFAETKTTAQAILKMNKQPLQQAGEADVHNRIVNQPPPAATNTITKPITTPVTQPTTTTTAMKAEKAVEDPDAEGEQEEEVKPKKERKHKKVKEEEDNLEPEEVKEPQEVKTEVTTAAKEPSKTTDFSDEVLNLLKRCYRIDELSLEEVKACVRDARVEKMWPLPKRAPQKARSDDGEARVLLDEDGLLESKIKASPRFRHFQQRLQANIFSPFSWQGILLWVVILGVFFALLPRLVHRRRTRSGMRSE